MTEHAPSQCGKDHDDLIELIARFEEFRIAIEDRLGKLNELRAEVTADRGMFVRIDVFQAQFESLTKTWHEWEIRLTQRISDLENWRSKAIGITIALTTLMGILGAVLGHRLG